MELTRIKHQRVFLNGVPRSTLTLYSDGDAPNVMGQPVGEIQTYLNTLTTIIQREGRPGLMRELKSTDPCKRDDDFIAKSKKKKRSLLRHLLFGSVFELKAYMVIECCLPQCSSEFDPSALKHCSRCKVAKYCCKACQKKHWKVHKPVCKVWTESAPGEKMSISKTKVQGYEQSLDNLDVGPEELERVLEKFESYLKL